MKIPGSVKTPVVVLDSCVLFGGKLTNLLLHLAAAGVFEPIWSEGIHAEWMRNLHVVTGIPLAKIIYRRNAMDKAFPAAKVQAPLDLVLSIQEICETARQRKDAHVVATAVAAGATLVVTHNIRDFAASVLSYCGLSKIKPDPFCVKLLRKVEAQVLEGVRAHGASLRRTPMSAIEYVEYLANPKFGMPNLARALAPHRGAI